MKPTEETSESVIHLDQVSFGVVSFTATGRTPLLCNRINADIEEILDKKGKATRDAAPKEVALEDLAYTNEAGLWVFPGAGIMKSLVHAARPTPLKMTLVRTVLSVLDAEPLIEGSTPRIVTHTARKDGKALIRVQRAEFPLPWRVCWRVSYVIGAIAPEQVVALASIAGFGVGWGVWRKECNGIYGQFTVEAEF